MNTIAIETSTKIVSVALLKGDKLIGEASSQKGESGSAALPRLLKELLDRGQIGFSELGLIAISIGPGSFTGLRIGVVTAKTLAYAHKIPVISVNSLQAIAEGTLHGANAIGDSHAPPQKILAAINAQRGQLFAGEFSVQQPENPQTFLDGDVQLVERDEWVTRAAELAADKNVWVTGAGIKPLVDELESTQVAISDHSCWQPKAAQVGKIGLRDFQQGRRDDFLKIEPLYFRPSAAEEKRLAAQADHSKP